MKRIIAIAIAALFIFAGDANAQSRNDAIVHYEQLSLDASFKQFKKATKTNQIEILNYLVSRANEEFYKCKTIDDLYNVKESLDMIKFYNNEAKQKSIAVTNAIRKLDRLIIDAERDYKGVKGVDTNTTEYSGWGQEIY